MQILKRILLVIANSVIPYYRAYKNSLLFSRMNGPSFYEYVKFRINGGGTGIIQTLVW